MTADAIMADEAFDEDVPEAPRPNDLTSRDWLGKSSAGLILGLTLAIGLTGLFAWFWPGGLMHSSAKTQMNMWLVAPIWTGVLSFCFLFRSSLRAWLWLGGANLLTWGLYFAGHAVIA